MFTRQNLLIFLGTLGVLFLLFYIFILPSTPPWEPSGRLVLAVRTVPGVTEDLIMFLGVDNVELYTIEGKTEKVTVLSRRIELVPGSDTLALVLDTNVPQGSYSGFGFTLKSPELRNSWQEEESPISVSLVEESVRLDTSYTVEEDITTAVILSFETIQAIHEKDGTKLYLPVIQIETRQDATVLPEDGETIQIQGGNIQSSTMFGMDWDGRMRNNFRAKPQAIEDPTVEELQPEVVPQVEIETPSLLDESLESSTTSSSSVTTKELPKEEVEEELLLE